MHPNIDANSDVQLESLERCVSKVHEWLLHNSLALNQVKSDAVQFSVGAGAHERTLSQRSTYPALKSNRQQPSRASESWINICRSTSKSTVSANRVTSTYELYDMFAIVFRMTWYRRLQSASGVTLGLLQRSVCSNVFGQLQETAVGHSQSTLARVLFNL